jgi:signal transduction histidine kinase
MDPFRVDVGIALLLCVVAVVEAATIDPHEDSRLLLAATSLSMCVWVAFRRRAPELAAIGLGATIAIERLFSTAMTEDTTVPFIAILLMLYSLGRHGSGRALWWGAAAVYGGIYAAVLPGDEDPAPEGLLWVSFVLVPPFLAGRALRARALLQRELRDKGERTEAERSARARRAIEEERQRIAGELQAVVANGVSAMVVQAEAVPRVLAAGDSARAGQALAVIEETGRDALAEMRRLLGVLRREGEQAQLAPQQGLSRVDALVERIRDEGLQVELRVIGDPRPLATGVDLTAYRVLEDALLAAREKKASCATAIVRYGDQDLELEVSDDRRGGASDRLPGLRDRVGLYGGHLRAEPRGESGFRLRANLPVDKVEA